MDQDEHRKAALEAAREMIRHLQQAYPHRTPPSIKRTCNLYVQHVLDGK